MSLQNFGEAIHRDWIRQARVQSDDADRRAAEPISATGATAVARFADDYFPGYQLDREIHRGAQGVVFRAIQRSSRRYVALKVMHEGPFATAADRARFEREVQLLAQLRHPDIVAIHDSGQVAGHHYLVIDYIDGQPLDAHVAARGRDLRETLGLMARICEAVNAAHLRGILHRDLKPSNILVDAGGAPHVLDFGLGRFSATTNEAEGSSAAATLTGQFVGSLPWCSPEQAAGGEIDIRTDVYSLGVLLYQMITGDFPYPVTGAVADVLQDVRTRAPRSARAVRRAIDDEVETIVLKSLQKEPARRYQSAGELARDLRRYLSGDPIEAKRDSAIYLLRKSLRRHWRMAAAGAVLLVAVLAGLVVSLALWRVATTQRDLALSAERQQSIERNRAEAESNKLRHVNQFVQNMLASAEPDATPIADISARSLLDNATREIDSGELRDQPEAEAAVRLTLGRAYTTLGAYEAARQHLEAALRIREIGQIGSDASLGETLLALAQVQRATEDLKSAESNARRGLAIVRRESGDVSVETAAAWETLSGILAADSRAEESVAAQREALAVWRATLGDQHPRVASSLANLATQLHWSDESEALLENAVRILEQTGSGHGAQAAHMLGQLARTQHIHRDSAAAERTYRRAIEAMREGIGGPNLQVFNTLSGLSLLYEQCGNWPRALETSREMLDVARALQPGDSERAVQALYQMCGNHKVLQQYEPAETAGREAVNMLKRIGKDQSANGLDTRANLAAAALKNAHLDVAEEAARECLEIADTALAGKVWLKAMAKSLLGEVAPEQGKYDEAEVLLTASFSELDDSAGARSTYRDKEREQALRRIVKMYEAWGKTEVAEEWRQRLPPPKP